LKARATTDGLTGVLNRSGLDKAIEEGLSKSSRGSDTSGVAILMIDIDHFKNFNDTHGHKAGDAVLVAVAKTIKEQLRKHDIVGRWGGEEFCVFLDDNISPEDARAKAEQIRKSVESLSVAFEEKKLNTTVSIGVVATKIGRDDDLQEIHNTLFKTADRLLYASKKNGRKLRDGGIWFRHRRK
jgi:diguanylate cyclase (GGDEF)-like protein